MKASTIVALALVGTGTSYVGYRALRPAEPNHYNSSTRPYGSGYRPHTTWLGGGGYGGRYGGGYGGTPRRPGGSSYNGGGNTSGTSRGGFGSTGHSSSSSS